MKLGGLTLAFALAVLAAGCLAPEVEELAPQSVGGEGDHRLQILVTDEPGGPPVGGALVRVFYDQDGPEHVAERLVLVTDAQGRAEARLPTTGAALVHAHASGWTREISEAVDLNGSRVSSLEVPLYREHLVLEFDALFKPADVSGHQVGLGSFHWSPEEVGFGSSPEAREGYARRTAHLNVTLTWTNTPTAHGDLGIGIGDTSDKPDRVADKRDLGAMGERSETLSLTYVDLESFGWRGVNTAYIGAGTGSAYVAPDGLPYKVTIEAHFDGDLARRESPGPGGLLGAIGALVGTALVMGRRR